MQMRHTNRTRQFICSTVRGEVFKASFIGSRERMAHFINSKVGFVTVVIATIGLLILLIFS